MITGMNITRETEEERLDRLRLSIDWCIMEKDLHREIKYRTHLLKAERVARRLRSNYYILVTDVTSVVIGPFDTVELALSHVVFNIRRGDPSDMRVLLETHECILMRGHMVVSPEEDLYFIHPDVT